MVLLMKRPTSLTIQLIMILISQYTDMYREIPYGYRLVEGRRECMQTTRHYLCCYRIQPLDKPKLDISD